MRLGLKTKLVDHLGFSARSPPNHAGSVALIGLTGESRTATWAAEAGDV